MNRREMLRLLAGALAVPALTAHTPEQLLALGRTVHRRARGGTLRALTPQQNETVAVIADLIIPTTDTPGARAAGVPAFIDLLVAEWYDDAERAAFRTGLSDVDARSRAAAGVDFRAATPAQQTAVLTALDAEAAGKDNHFFSRMKWVTLYGYYTSEIGVTRELRDVVIPGRYDPCAATGTPVRGGDSH